MAKWKHKLKKLNTENRTAICENCGPVRVKKKQKGYRCYKAVYEENKRSPSYGKGKSRECSETECKLCGDQAALVWDHNHETGRFRGWLCRLCNVGLGMFRDRPELLAKAIIYLETTKATD